MTKLTQIKLLHTAIWAIEVIAIVYIVYTGIVGVFNGAVIISFVLVFIEVIILLYYKWKCPLTLEASKHTSSTHIGFDIFLPQWVAKHNKTIFGTLFVTGTLLHVLYQLV